MRITGQLIDTLSGTHLWADRFDMLIDARLAMSLIRDAARFVPEIAPLAVRMIGPAPEAPDTMAERISAAQAADGRTARP